MVPMWSVGLEEARTVIEQIKKFVVEDGGDPVAIAIVGSDGGLIAFEAMDRVFPISRELAIKKAETALKSGCSTLKWEKEGGLDCRNFGDSGFTCFGGGVPIIRPYWFGQRSGSRYLVLGAVGVSGRNSHKGKEDTTAQDHELARFGDEAIGYDLILS